MIRILVAEDDLPRARIILRDVARENVDVDWSQVDVGKPEEE